MFPGIDKVLGTLLIGTWLNSMLYTLEIVAVIQYYIASKRIRDSRWLQGVVYFTLFVDTISTLANNSCAYFYTITRWGNPHFHDRGFWPCVASVVTTCVSEMIVQLFLIYRYYRMSKKKYATAMLILFVLVEFGGSIEAIHMYRTISFHERKKMVASIVIWFSMSAATDIAIALALIWQLSRVKSPFKSTQSLIHKLMAGTMRTGTVTSVVVLVTLILFLLDNQSNAPMTPGFCLGRIYALTMLYNLNGRHTYKGGLNDYSGETTNNLTVMKFVQVHTTTGLLGLSTVQDPDLSDLPKAYISSPVEKDSDLTGTA